MSMTDTEKALEIATARLCRAVEFFEELHHRDDNDLVEWEHRRANMQAWAEATQGLVAAAMREQAVAMMVEAGQLKSEADDIFGQFAADIKKMGG